MASGSAMGRAMMRAALAGSKSSPAHRRLLHGSPSHRTSTSKEEVDILLDRLKETGTKSMDMATLDQTLDSTLGCNGP
uniref:Uncharacterized protein n=2 Tax=Oryza TaxID=4527 RepID=A0A0D3GLC8_9ORYZ